MSAEDQFDMLFGGGNQGADDGAMDANDLFKMVAGGNANPIDDEPIVDEAIIVEFDEPE